MTTGATQSLSQRLATFFKFRRSRALSGLGAFALPVEIILEISLHLDNTSRTSLALTCRTFNLCFYRNPPLEPAETEQLLLLLERDLARLYYCHYCVKLHPWKRRASKSIRPRCFVDTPCKEEINYYPFPTHFYEIPYHYARVVMNRHLYGPEHGPSLTKLTERIRESCFCYKGLSNSVTQEARIVDDQLLILSLISWSHSKGDSKFLKDRMNFVGHSVCPHLTLGTGFVDHAPRQLPELAHDNTTSRPFTPCEQSRGSCTVCLTDYSIDITWRGEKKGFLIQVAVFRQLGDCRSPFDWVWHNSSTMYPKQEGRMARTVNSEKYRPGCVRDRWNGARCVVRDYKKWAGVRATEKAGVY
jgi:hypothetical protein